MTRIELAAALLIVAHRGASADAPENTLPAFELAWEQGADGIEGDFRLSKDGHIVCFHDSQTQKMAGQDLTVATSTLAELRTLDVGSWKDPKYQNTRIPTLPEVLASIPEGKQIYLEIKVGPEIIPALQKALATSTLKQEQITVISFDTAFVTAWKKTNPKCKTMLIISYKRWRWRPSPSADKTLALLAETGADGLSSNAHSSISRKFVKRLRTAGYEHHVWTIDQTPLARRFIKAGTQSITTNRPGALRAALEQQQ